MVLLRETGTSFPKAQVNPVSTICRLLGGLLYPNINFTYRRSQGRGFGRIQAEGNDDHDHNSPKYVVRSIASDRDDYYMPALTIRVWVIGSIICGLNGFFKARAVFEEDTFDIPPVLVQFLSPFLGWLMVAVLPKKSYKSSMYKRVYVFVKLWYI